MPKKKDVFVTLTFKRLKDKNDNHYHAILDDIDDKHVSVGLTTQRKKGKKATRINYPLENDPIGNLGEGEKSYMRRAGTVAPRKKYRSPKQGHMTTKDFAAATAFGERAKQKYLANKDKKKK